MFSRILCRLNAQITDTLGSVSASFVTGLTMSITRLTYLDICDDCATVTQLFQTQLFINIVGNVFGVTFMMLSAFNTLMSEGANTIRITLYFLYDSLVRTLQMYFIIDVCHTTVEQVLRLRTFGLNEHDVQPSSRLGRCTGDTCPPYIIINTKQLSITLNIINIIHFTSLYSFGKVNGNHAFIIRYRISFYGFQNTFAGF
jgi:hypothetical protein